MRLFYNAFHPIEILKERRIRSSIVCGRNRGVSMSSQMIDSHGPFTFVFREGCHWYRQFKEVQYGVWEQVDFLHKPLMFENEYEWHSERDVSFLLGDIERIIFRSDSCGARITPRINRRNFKQLPVFFPDVLLMKEGA